MQNERETTFGSSLRLAREAKQLTQTQLANLVGTSQQNIAGMEAGRSLPKEAIYDKLCEVFGKHSDIAQLPPRGVIKLGYDTVENARVKSERRHTVSEAAPEYKATALSPQARELAELFDMLPQDRLTRVAVHRECTGLLLAHLAHAATQVVSGVAVLEHKP